jgi:hypothetical protein
MVILWRVRTVNFKSTPYTPLFGINTSDKVLRYSKRTEVILNSGSDLFLAAENIFKLAPRTLEETLGGPHSPRSSQSTPHTQLTRPTQHTTIHHSFNWVHRFNSALTVKLYCDINNKQLSSSLQRQSYHAVILCLRS